MFEIMGLNKSQESFNEISIHVKIRLNFTFVRRFFFTVLNPCFAAKQYFSLRFPGYNKKKTFNVFQKSVPFYFLIISNVFSLYITDKSKTWLFINLFEANMENPYTEYE